MIHAEPAGKNRSQKSWNMVGGIIFVAIAVVFGAEATNYEFGRTVRMGPGFIPLVLSILLGCFGVWIAIADFSNHRPGSDQPVAWRGIVLISVSLLIFGAYVRSMGLVPCVFLCTFLTSLASSRNTVFLALLNAIVLSAVCWFVFKLGLEMSPPTIGPAFGQFQVL